MPEQMKVKVGDDSYEKKPNILEHIAYRDTWGLGADSFLSMIYERLIIMKDLLAKLISIKEDEEEEEVLEEEVLNEPEDPIESRLISAEKKVTKTSGNLRIVFNSSGLDLPLEQFLYYVHYILFYNG